MKRARALYIAVPRQCVDAIIRDWPSENDPHVLDTLRSLCADADVLIQKRIRQRQARSIAALHAAEQRVKP